MNKYSAFKSSSRLTKNESKSSTQFFIPKAWALRMDALAYSLDTTAFN